MNDHIIRLPATRRASLRLGAASALSLWLGINTGLKPVLAAAPQNGKNTTGVGPIASWDALIPEDWEPLREFQDMMHLFELPDSDMRVQQLYERMRKVWDEAPIVPALAGQAARLPGYVVPLESDKYGLREFLLVPYFGACIHTPPPPANQIIHVRLDAPARGFKTMDAVWVNGVLSIERKNNDDMGVSGYRMAAEKITLHTGK